MRLFFPDPSKTKNLPSRLRQAGYRLERQVNEQELAFIKSFESVDFPRWHLYAKEIDGGWDLNLHLDQKRPVYRGNSAHAGEYDGLLVEKEMARLEQFLK